MKQAELFKAITEQAKTIQEALLAIGKTKKKKATKRDKKILKALEKEILLKKEGINPTSLSAVALAKLLGYSEKQISRHYKDYEAPRNPDKSFDLEKYLSWYRQWKDEEIKKAELDHGSDSGQAKINAEIELKKSQTEWTQLKLAKEKGELVSLAEADDRMRNVLYTLKKRLDALPSSASRIMGKDLVTSRKEMEKIAFEICAQLAHEASKPLTKKQKNDS